MYPAPLGNLAKERPDKSLKFRLIWDLKANQVNSVARVPERQVLPRGLDHAQDLAELAQHETLSVIVLDFKNAFMSVPLHPVERPFNVSILEDPIDLQRDTSSTDDVKRGRCIVWRVLGFGG